MRFEIEERDWSSASCTRNWERLLDSANSRCLTFQWMSDGILKIVSLQYNLGIPSNPETHRPQSIDLENLITFWWTQPGK